MAILITGGNGFLGRHVIRKLTKYLVDEPVISLDTSFSFPSFGSDVIEEEIDILNLEDLVGFAEKHKVRMIVHLVSMLNNPSQKDPVSATRINIGGTVNVLEAARLASVKRVIYASSGAIYGQNPNKGITEDEPKEPTSIYGTTKLTGELYGRNYQKSYGLEFISLRITHIYGKGRERGFTKISQLIEKAAKGLRVSMTGGDQAYDLVYVKDVANAFCNAVMIKQLAHCVYNIAGGKLTTLNDLSEMIRIALPAAEINLEGGIEEYRDKRGYLDISRGREDGVYKPEFDIESGIQDYIKEIKDLNDA